MHTVGFHPGGSGVLLVGVLSLGYYTICESLLGGTVGKLALGLRVVDEDGDEISFSAALVRMLPSQAWCDAARLLGRRYARLTNLTPHQL
jgi:uncharacterized RDD family membrane protein YckC